MAPRRAAIVMLVAMPTIAMVSKDTRAEGPVAGGRTPRSIGRAGVGTASDDGGGALLVNPAGLARRDAARMQLGVAFLDDEVSWLHSESAPLIRDQSSSRLLPLIAIEGAVGDWVLGAGAMTTAHSERLFRRPGTNFTPADYGNSFEYRFTGLGGSFRRDTVVVGAAHRIGDSVAVGISAAGSYVQVGEVRRIWAGNGAPTNPNNASVPIDPKADIELGMTASAYTPSVVAGVLIAPEDTHVEIAASASWSAPARAHGSVVGEAAFAPFSTEVGATGARIEIEQPVVVRTGVRWLGERWIGEVGGDLWVVPKRARSPVWRFDDMTIVDATTIGRPRAVQLATLPSRLSTQTQGALRGSLDVELIGGFLWATAGYAFTTAGTAGTRMSPTFGDLGGHTAAVGLEATAGGFTVTFGVARTWSVKQPEPVSQWQLDNPFGSGDAMVPEGTYDGSIDLIGLSIDAELWAPE